MSIEIINGVPTRMLDEVFWKNGCLYVRVADGEGYYVYEVVSRPKPDVLPDIKEWDFPNDDDTGNYEIIAKRIVPKSTLDEHTEYENIEKYPSNEEWGSFGWTYTEWKNVKRAIRKKFSKGELYTKEEIENANKAINQMSMYN